MVRASQNGDDAKPFHAILYSMLKLENYDTKDSLLSVI